MPNAFRTVGARRIEAGRLIELARAMLDAPAEQLVIDYLDHAAAALHDLGGENSDSAVRDRPTARAQGRD